MILFLFKPFKNIQVVVDMSINTNTVIDVQKETGMLLLQFGMSINAEITVAIMTIAISNFGIILPCLISIFRNPKVHVHDSNGITINPQ